MDRHPLYLPPYSLRHELSLIFHSLLFSLFSPFLFILVICSSWLPVPSVTRRLPAATGDSGLAQGLSQLGFALQEQSQSGKLSCFLSVYSIGRSSSWGQPQEGRCVLKGFHTVGHFPEGTEVDPKPQNSPYPHCSSLLPLSCPLLD